VPAHLPTRDPPPPVRRPCGRPAADVRRIPLLPCRRPLLLSVYASGPDHLCAGGRLRRQPAAAAASLADRNGDRPLTTLTGSPYEIEAVPGLTEPSGTASFASLIKSGH